MRSSKPLAGGRNAITLSSLANKVARASLSSLREWEADGLKNRCGFWCSFKVCHEPKVMLVSAQCAWMRRWRCMCAASQAFALSLLHRRAGLGSDGPTPTTSDVVVDCRHFGATDCIVCPAPSVWVFFCVLFSLFSFVLHSLAILPDSIVLDIVEGQRRRRGPKNGQNSLCGKNIEKIREPKNCQNSIWGKTGHLLMCPTGKRQSRTGP